MIVHLLLPVRPALPVVVPMPGLPLSRKLAKFTLEWEKHSIAQAEQRPPRKYYEMTRAGREALAEAVKRYRLLEQTQLDKKRDQKPSRA